jgi:predicted amidohydrolase
VKVFCCQHDIAWEDKAATHARVRALLASGDLPGDSLLVLPEMFATGFSVDVPRIAEGDARSSERFLAGLARERGIHVQGGVVNAAPDGRGRNESVTFAPDGREIARYVKMQPFTLGGETARFAAGAGPITFRWGECLVAPFICYDLRFPEIFRVVARQAPQLITVIASWPDARLGQWVKLLQARAIENQCYVAGVNRVGSDPQLHYSGRSMIVDFRGDIVADAGDGEKVIGATLDLPALAEYRSALPFLADIRPDFVPDAHSQ